MKVNHNITSKQRRMKRVRTKVRGTAERPRLNVFRSNRFTYLQAINDQDGKTIASENSKGFSTAGTKIEEAKATAKALAEKLKTAKVKKLVFDRGSYKYHGRVKAVAEVMREHGMEM